MRFLERGTWSMKIYGITIVGLRHRINISKCTTRFFGMQKVIAIIFTTDSTSHTQKAHWKPMRNRDIFSEEVSRVSQILWALPPMMYGIFNILQVFLQRE